MGSSISALLTDLILTMGDLPMERLQVAVLDRKHCLISTQTLAEGGATSLFGTFRPIVSWALGLGARAMVLAHNHPSGSSLPSRADIEFTRNIKLLCRPLEIELIDHFVIGGRSAFSMKRAGMI